MQWRLVYRTFDGKDLEAHADTLREAKECAERLSNDAHSVAVYRRNGWLCWTYYGTCFHGQWLYSWTMTEV